MSTETVPAGAGELLESVAGSLAGLDPAEMPAGCVPGMERVDAEGGLHSCGRIRACGRIRRLIVHQILPETRILP
jgi:hypothetical protein